MIAPQSAFSLTQSWRGHWGSLNQVAYQELSLKTHNFLFHMRHRSVETRSLAFVVEGRLKAGATYRSSVLFSGFVGGGPQSHNRKLFSSFVDVHGQLLGCGRERGSVAV